MKLPLAAAFVGFVASVSGQVIVRKCHGDGIKSKVSEGLEIANQICQLAANRPIANRGSIKSCVPYHSDGTTEQTDYHWLLTVTHNGPGAAGVPPLNSDPNQCVLAISAVLRQCGDGYLTKGGYGYIGNNLIEWEIDPDHEDKC